MRSWRILQAAAERDISLENGFDGSDVAVLTVAAPERPEEIVQITALCPPNGIPSICRQLLQLKQEITATPCDGSKLFERLVSQTPRFPALYGHDWIDSKGALQPGGSLRCFYPKTGEPRLYYHYHLERGKYRQNPQGYMAALYENGRLVMAARQLKENGQLDYRPVRRRRKRYIPD